jgi:hypothetical protein
VDSKSTLCNLLGRKVPQWSKFGGSSEAEFGRSWECNILSISATSFLLEKVILGNYVGHSLDALHFLGEKAEMPVKIVAKKACISWRALGYNLLSKTRIVCSVTRRKSALEQAFVGGCSSPAYQYTVSKMSRHHMLFSPDISHFGFIHCNGEGAVTMSASFSCRFTHSEFYAKYQLKW